MFNKVLLLGLVVDKPSMHTFENGCKVANFTLKTTENWIDGKTGLSKERPQYHKIAIFNDRIVDFLLGKVDIGSTVYIEGQSEGRKHVDVYGDSHHLVQIVLRSGRGQLTLIDAKDKEITTEFQS
jgi:single-strand DNA-binding protein